MLGSRTAQPLNFFRKLVEHKIKVIYCIPSIILLQCEKFDTLHSQNCIFKNIMQSKFLSHLHTPLHGVWKWERTSATAWKKRKVITCTCTCTLKIPICLNNTLTLVINRGRTRNAAEANVSIWGLVFTLTLEFWNMHTHFGLWPVETQSAFHLLIMCWFVTNLSVWFNYIADLNMQGPWKSVYTTSKSALNMWDNKQSSPNCLAQIRIWLKELVDEGVHISISAQASFETFWLIP